MTPKLIFSIPAALAIFIGPLAAQDAAIDVNADGMYSYPELLSIMPEMTEEEFTLLDVSGDGLLDVDEIATATEAGMLRAMDG